jgi:hypothetical protein
VKARTKFWVQVAVLRARATALGNWYPVNFPNNTVTPKMHSIIYHVAEIAELIGSVGQTTEQVIESFHASMNTYGRNYVCIQNTCLRYESQTKNQWARSAGGEGSVRNYKAPTNKKCNIKVKSGLRAESQARRNELKRARKQQRIGFYD